MDNPIVKFKETIDTHDEFDTEFLRNCIDALQNELSPRLDNINEETIVSLANSMGFKVCVSTPSYTIIEKGRKKIVLLQADGALQDFGCAMLLQATKDNMWSLICDYLFELLCEQYDTICFRPMADMTLQDFLRR